MSVIVLITGHEIAVEQAPAEAQATLVDLVEHGHDWAFSELTGAWFQTAHVVAILPDESPAPKKAAKQAARA